MHVSKALHAQRMVTHRVARGARVSDLRQTDDPSVVAHNMSARQRLSSPHVPGCHDVEDGEQPDEDSFHDAVLLIWVDRNAKDNSTSEPADGEHLHN